MTRLRAFRHYLPPHARSMLLTRALGAWGWVKALAQVNAFTGGFLPHESSKHLSFGLPLIAFGVVLVLLGGR